MWVFVYKTDKHGFLQKCKARIQRTLIGRSST
jgi:hypothetical protein